MKLRYLVGMAIALIAAFLVVSVSANSQPSQGIYVTGSNQQAVVAGGCQSSPVPQPTPSAGQVFPVQCASPGTLNVSTPAPAPTGTTGAVLVEPYAYNHGAQANPSSSPVAFKASAGTLGGVQFYNGAGVTNFIQIFNNVPASITLGSTAPDKIVPCATLTFCFLPTPAQGVIMSLGMTAYCTTTSTGATGCATGTYLTWDYR